jgi:uncharacterized repeat protein (TIGR03803 family)
VGGTVSGLASGQSLTLQDNGGDDLVVTANGSFTFSNPLTTGASYAVTVLTQPSGQTCTVANGSGTVADSNITNVVVTCVSVYTVGGTVSGLASGQSLTLQDNGGDDLVVTANGSFTFSNPLTTGASYAVTVLTQPSGQTCTVANGSGTVADSNITNVAVTCWTESVLYSFTDDPDGAGPEAGLVDVGGNLYGTTNYGGTGSSITGDGTVFEITPAGVETVLHSFAGQPNDGAYPSAGLVDVDGTLYGTTYEGGTNNDGTVFEINPSTGQETVLYSFTGANGDGAFPEADLVDVDGTLYGTTYEGGTNNDGTVFEITPAGVETVLHSFAGQPNDGANPLAGLVDVDGTLYGTTSAGGTSGNGTVFEINPSTGEETVLYSFTGANGDGSYPAAGLVMGANGNLYGTTYYGGTNNDGTVFEINPSTGDETVLYSFTGANGDGAYPSAGLVDVDGNLYGTTEYGGTDDAGTVFEITPAGVETVIHSFAGLPNDGTGPEAGLVDVDGTLYGTTNDGGTNNDGTVFQIVP